MMLNKLWRKITNKDYVEKLEGEIEYLNLILDSSNSTIDTLYKEWEKEKIKHQKATKRVNKITKKYLALKWQ